MYRFPFTLQELCIESWAISQRVGSSLIHDHILEVLPFRLSTGYPMTASRHSGYRSYSYEKRKGRSGDSQHTFPKRSGKTGAVDWTCIDKTKNVELLKYLIEESSYSRIAYQTDSSGGISYIHCDHLPVDARQLFTYNKKGDWEFIRHI